MYPKPLKDRVIIKPIPVDDITEGGLIIPEEAKNPPVRGEIVAVGPGTKDMPMDVEVGQKILHLAQAGMEIEWEKEGLKILRSVDIIVVL